MHPLLIFVTRGVSLGGVCRRTGGQSALLRAICAGHFQRRGKGGQPTLFLLSLFFPFIYLCHKRTFLYIILQGLPHALF